MKKKILIVEDEQDVAIYLETLFQDNGYRALIAHDGEEGSRLAESERPDLITLDMTMPVQSGVKTYNHFKNDMNLKNTPVIVITAVGDSINEIIEKFKGLPVPENFISKPIEPQKLLQAIAEVLNT